MNIPEAEDLALAAEGKLRPPEAALPVSFWSMPAPRVTLKRVAAAVEAERRKLFSQNAVRAYGL